MVRIRIRRNKGSSYGSGEGICHFDWFFEYYCVFLV
jgi:hypothetical protein